MSRRTTIRMKTLQSADLVLGLVSCVLAQPLAWWLRLWRRPVPPHRVLLIKFWGIGSLQLLSPGVVELRRRHPEARVTLLTLRENAAFARGMQLFDEVLTLDVASRSWTVIFGRILGCLRALRADRFDHVFDLEFFTRFSAVVALASGARELHGFRSPRVWRGGFHTRTVPFNRYWHVARNFRALLGGEDGAEVRVEDLVPYRAEGVDRQRVRSMLAEADVAGRPYAVLNPNAGRLSLERRWPVSSFADLARRLVEDDGMSVVLVGSPSEVDHSRSVADAITAADVIGAAPPGTVLDLSGQLTVGELCALLEDAAVVVSNDSGPMHLAAALDTPTVGLFGPETPVMYAPLGRSTRALYDPPVCSPCINVHDNKLATCIHGRPECLVNLDVERVLSAARDLVAREVWVPRPETPPAGTRRWRVLEGGATATESANG